ncbi:YtzH-like family protein [Cytobacillus sp. S13-E01]|uniref:YtzH-like family protein n=1 Tax=Cytobacillus sp. S13-E01 TaxID=3031326 RepID=UPI0023D80463|nr:YtzH-like family protein [Cytobacillus sp. S13-E01]MDF0726471.1 YtzH-like family protein [Cytobacillus sp. S13-E01]
MPINHTDQMNVLKDILTNQQADCCGTVAECEQMERIIKSLMVNTNVDQNLKSVLDDIYSYSQNGKYTQHLDSHIDSHRSDLTQWVNDIDSFS